VYYVLICDMFHYLEPEHELQVDEFATLEQAREFARRRVRDSLEELRRPGQSREELRSLWYAFGEDATVVSECGGYRGSSELDCFIDHPATAEERDWLALYPRKK
jgi:hypothetical protein